MNKSQTIVLVDDDPHWLDVLSKRLTKLGYHVAQALSAAEAQRLAATVHPSMILVDRGLPGDGALGRSVLQQLRDSSGLKGIPVFMTNARRQRAGFSS